MTKPVIDQSTPWGGPVANVVARIQAIGADCARIAEAKPLALAGGGTLDANAGGAQFGGSPGSHNDYEYALDFLLANVEAFMTANAGYLAQLDQGNPL